MVKNLPANAGDLRDMGAIPRWGRSHGVGNGNPFPYSCLEKSHGQRSLAGYSPWSHKESDMTEHLSNKIGDKLTLLSSLTKPLKIGINK